MTYFIKGIDVASLARKAADAYSKEVELLAQATKNCNQALLNLEKQLAQAWEQLTVTLVPGLVDEHLNWVANLIHLPAVAAAPVRQRLAEHREALLADIKDIETDPKYIEREARLNACDIEISELMRALEPLRTSLNKIEAEPNFLDLIYAEYDTEKYAHKFWELIYYRHWKHGDRIVENFGGPRGFTRFAEIRDNYSEESKARHTLEQVLDPVVGRQRHITGLIDRRAALLEVLENLDDRHWAQTRARVHEHLRGLPDDMPQLLASYEPGLYAAKRVLGMQAKKDYLQTLRETWLHGPLAKAKTKLAKAKRGVVKYRRSKNSYRQFSRTELTRKYMVPQEKWNKRWKKWRDAYPRIVEYNRYSDYDFDADTIWWHEMTSGRVKARFIPEVSQYYSNRAQAKKAARETSAHDDALAALAEEALTTNTDENWDDYS